MKLEQNRNRSSCWGFVFLTYPIWTDLDFQGLDLYMMLPEKWELNKEGCTSSIYRCRKWIWPLHKRTDIRRNLEIYWQTPNKTSIKNYCRRRQLKYSTNSEEGHCLWKYYTWGDEKSYRTVNSEVRGQVLLTAVFWALKQCLA